MAMAGRPHVIIGAGAVGTAAARHLAARGEPVLLLEQFAISHARGSSHGLARITRHSYADEPHARAMIEAFRGWRELEAEAGEPLYIRTGGVSIGPAGSDYVERVAASLGAIAVPHRRLAGRELRRSLPMFAPADDAAAVFEPDAGLLRASRIVEIQAEQARLRGAILRERCPVLALDLDGSRPRVVLDGETIEAERVIVAAGAWVGRLLGGAAAALRPTRQQVLYFAPADPSPFQIGRFPIWIAIGPDPEDAFYGMPEFQGGGVKAARHFGPEVDPGHNDPRVAPDYVDLVRGFLRGLLPGLADAPLQSAEVCLYTMAADEQFVVGPWAGRADVLIASPCSGHGFKFSNQIGEVLADLATVGTSSRQLPGWAASRL